MDVNAIHLEDDANVNFWDALIAARSGARRVLSEDLNAGRAIAGGTIQNPCAGLRVSQPGNSPRSETREGRARDEVHGPRKHEEGLLGGQSGLTAAGGGSYN